MNIWDLLIPQTMEKQRRLARERFAAGVSQPEVFNTENVPIAQLAQDYEKGYGIPYPTRQPSAPAPVSPTAPEHVQNLATNMPIELVAPRTAEQSAMRTAGIQGRAGAESEIAGIKRYGEELGLPEGFLGEDAEDFELSAIGPFQRPQPTEPGESYGTLIWDPKIGSYRQQELTSRKWGTVGKKPGEGGGGGSSDLDKIYDDALNTYKAIVAKAKLDPTTALMLQMLPDPSRAKPLIEGYVSPQLTPDERAQLEQAIQIMDYIQKQRRSGFKLGNIPMEAEQQEAATAEDYLRKKGLKP